MAVAVGVTERMGADSVGADVGVLGAGAAGDEQPAIRMLATRTGDRTVGMYFIVSPPLLSGLEVDSTMMILWCSHDVNL